VSQILPSVCVAYVVALLGIRFDILLTEDHRTLLFFLRMLVLIPQAVVSCNEVWRFGWLYCLGSTVNFVLEYLFLTHL